MKHSSNRELFAHWNERRGNRLAPERADIEPGAIRQVLGDTFVLGVDGMNLHPFRLAGTRLCALFGRELKGASFIELWERSGRIAVRELLAVVMEEKAGVVASVTAATADDSVLAVNMELLLLPLDHQSKAEARILGAMAPLTVPYWLGVKSISPLKLGVFRTSEQSRKRYGHRRSLPRRGGCGTAWWSIRVAGAISATSGAANSPLTLRE